MAKLTGLNGGAGDERTPMTSEQLAVENTERMITFGAKINRLRDLATDYSTTEHDRSGLLGLLHEGVDQLLQEAEALQLEQRARTQTAGLAADEDSLLARSIEHKALEIYGIHGDTALTTRLIGEMTVYALEEEVAWRAANPTVILADER